MNGARAKQIRKAVPRFSSDQSATEAIRTFSVGNLFETIFFHTRKASDWKRRYRQAKRLYTRTRGGAA